MFPSQARGLIVDAKAHAANNIKQLAKVDKNKIDLFKMMLGGIVYNTKQLFVPPILRYTLISVTINLTFHIG